MAGKRPQKTKIKNAPYKTEDEGSGHGKEEMLEAGKSAGKGFAGLAGWLKKKMGKQKKGNG